MTRFHRWILDEKDPSVILKRSTVWNLASSLLNASATALIILCLSWSGKSELSGVFSIATAIAYQVQAIGFFGVRNYHIQDVKSNYRFSEYVVINELSSVIMVAALCFMAFGRGYSLEKALIILFYSLYRAVEIYEALFHDEYQRKGRIDIGLILQTVRFLITLTILVVTIITTGNMVLACFMAFFSSVILIWWQNRDFYKIFNCQIEKTTWKRTKKLAAICLPICLTGFISMYLTNASKYAIDQFLDDKAQGVFAVLFVPVFTINMLSLVIYRPYITKIAQEWHDEKTKDFIRDVARQVLVITMLTIGITVFGYFIGLNLLALIYHMDLSSYQMDFVILLIGGGFNTYSVFLLQILVIVGCQNLSLVIYVLSLAVTWFSSQLLVEGFGLTGASILYLLSAVILVLGSIFVLIFKVRRRR